MYITSGSSSAQHTSHEPHIDTLRQTVQGQLDHIGRPQAGWFFEALKGGGVEKLNAKELKGIQSIIHETNNINNILSFGAREGGFELAMQLQHDMNMNPKSTMTSPYTNYLDATSLKHHDFTELEKIKGLDVYKMKNPFWDVGYKNGVAKASGAMHFLITPEWLNSDFCHQEFNWMKENNRPSLDVTFSMFPDVDHNHPRAKEIATFAEKNPHARILPVTSETLDSLKQVEIKDSAPLSFKRNLSQEHLYQMLNKNL